MGRPKIEKYIVARIDKELDDYIRNFSKNNGLVNYRQASKELVKWMQEIEIEWARKRKL